MLKSESESDRNFLIVTQKAVYDAGRHLCHDPSIGDHYVNVIRSQSGESGYEYWIPVNEPVYDV